VRAALFEKTLERLARDELRLSWFTSLAARPKKQNVELLQNEIKA